MMFRAGLLGARRFVHRNKLRRSTSALECPLSSISGRGRGTWGCLLLTHSGHSIALLNFCDGQT
jgi:hypothetical protein